MKPNQTNKDRLLLDLESSLSSVDSSLDIYRGTALDMIYLDIQVKIRRYGLSYFRSKMAKSERHLSHFFKYVDYLAQMEKQLNMLKSELSQEIVTLKYDMR